MPNFRTEPDPPRHYTPDQLGGVCPGCGQALPAALAGLEEEHPTCDPDWPPLRAASKRAEKRAALRYPNRT